MNNTLSYWLQSIFNLGVMAVVLTTLFLFSNLTTDFYEFPKFLVLLTFSGVLLFLTVLKFVLDKKVVLVRTPLDGWIAAFLLVAAISTYISPSSWVSLMGLPKVNGSLISLIVYFLFYFLLVHNLKRPGEISQIFNLLKISGLVLSVLALFSYVGIKYLPLNFTQALNFTPTGSSFSTAAILALLVPLPLLSIIGSPGQGKVINAIILSVFAATILLIGSWPVYVAALAGLLLALIISGRAPVKRSLPLLFLPVLITLVVAFVSFSSVAGKADYPKEVQLPFVISWKVSVSAFRDSPLIGTGPATYSFNFTAYKPLEVLSTNFWNLRLDSPFNEYLGILASLGGLGLVIFTGLSGVFILSAIKSLRKPNLTDHSHLNLYLPVAGIVFYIILLLHPATLPVWVIGILILASFMAFNHQLTKQFHIKIAASKSEGGEVQFDALPVILLALVMAGIGVSFLYISRFALADFKHRRALTAVSQNQGLEAYNLLIEAAKLNPRADSYRVNLANTNFALANAIASSKRPSEASPDGSLTEEDKRNIRQLLQQAIGEGRIAVTLSSRNAVNWEALGSIYRQITGVSENAMSFALDSYGRALRNDPLNPILRLIVGGMHYQNKNYDLAVRFFTDAVTLKPDWANGYYNLSVALRDKGDLKAAQAAAERAVSLIDPAAADYKTASDYLAELKAATATSSAEIVPPAAQETSQLQRPGPEVLNLPKPGEVTQPEPLNTPTPSPKP